MATDGPGLMQGDQSSDFCYTVYNTIDDNGILSIDKLINKINSDDENYRLTGEFIDVICNGNIRAEMWSCYSNDEDDPNGYIYTRLKKVISSRSALEKVLNELNNILIEYIDPVICYKLGYGDIGKNLALEYKKIHKDKFNKQFEAENEKVTAVFNRMLKDEVTTIQQAQEHREIIKKLYSKLKMLRCSEATSKAFNEIFNHGWTKEEYYQDMVNHIASNIKNLKNILSKQQLTYVLYLKDDAKAKLRNPCAKYGVAKVIKETNEILWDHETMPRAEFKNLMTSGAVEPSNMYILNGRLYEMTMTKIVDEYFDDLAKAACNQLIHFGCIMIKVLQDISNFDDLVNKSLIPQFKIEFQRGTLLNNYFIKAKIRGKNKKLEALLNDLDSDKFPEFQNAFIEKLKGKVGSNNLYIALVVENPDDFDVYHFYYYITTRNASNNVTFENGAIGKVIIL